MVAAGDADRADQGRVVRGQRGLAGHRLDDGDGVRLGEHLQLELGAAVVHATAGDDQRARGLPQQVRGSHEVVQRGARPGHRARRHLVEERDREVVGLGLHVLRQAQEDRAAIGRVEHRGNRLRQARQQLRRARDPVPVPRHRAEGVVDGRRRRVEVLDLLQHRIGQAARERVAGQQQQRQPVRVGHRGGRDHVRGARSDRRGGDHDPAPAERLRVGHAGQRHALLVLAAEHRQLVARVVQRLAQRQHVAVPEDAEHAREQAVLLPVDVRLLGDQVAHQRLRRREPDRLHRDNGASARAALLERVAGTRV